MFRQGSKWGNWMFATLYIVQWGTWCLQQYVESPQHSSGDQTDTYVLYWCHKQHEWCCYQPFLKCWTSLGNTVNKTNYNNTLVPILEAHWRACGMQNSPTICTFVPHIAGRHIWDPTNLCQYCLWSLWQANFQEKKKCDWHTVDQRRNIRAAEGEERLISLFLSGIS